MLIAGYLKTSLIEWPGKIASVVFTQGCNFRCPFCHNADLVQSKRVGERESETEQESKRVKEREMWTTDKILTDLKKRKKWIDAVVITGGEPTLQGDLIEFIKLIRLIEGTKVMVETNGSRPEVIKKLIDGKLVDKWSMDVKSNFEGYGGIVGDEGKIISKIKESMGLIANSGVEYEFRTTVVPGIHDLESLRKLAWEIREMRERRVELKWFLQQFRPVNCLDKSFLKKKGFAKEEMEGFLVEVKKIIPNTFLRGI